MSVFVWPALVMLVAAALLEVWRMVQGPTVLDRTLAADVLVATIVCALGVEAVARDHSTTLPVLVSLSMVGFVATVAVSRFVSDDRDAPAEGDPADGDGRIDDQDGGGR